MVFVQIDKLIAIAFYAKQFFIFFLFSKGEGRMDDDCRV